MQDLTPANLSERLVRAVPGIYIDEQEPEKVYLHIKEILAARHPDPDDALLGATATKLIAMYANEGILATVIDDE